MWSWSREEEISFAEQETKILILRCKDQLITGQERERVASFVIYTPEEHEADKGGLPQGLTQLHRTVRGQGWKSPFQESVELWRTADMPLQQHRAEG
jgi:hypothetical protein